MKQQEIFLGWEKPGKALITGASAGIGLCFAKQLAQKGLELVMLTRRKDRLHSVAQEMEAAYAIRCEIMPTDISDVDEIKKVPDLIREMDNLDVLINNAGFATIGYFAGEKDKSTHQPDEP